jgi:hypothetical protein
LWEEIEILIERLIPLKIWVFNRIMHCSVLSLNVSPSENPYENKLTVMQ